MKLFVVAISTCLVASSIANVYTFVYEESVSNANSRQSEAKYPQQCNSIPDPVCDKFAKYQTLDGTCNSLKYTKRGAGGTILSRFLPPEYDDGYGSPRQRGIRGNRLPLPREISNKLKSSSAPASKTVSHLHVLFGQLLAHDIVHTPVSKTPQGTPLDCSCHTTNKECIHVDFPYSDIQRFYEGKKCFGRSRSRPAVPVGCELKNREQTTTMSSYIDGTFLYGKSDSEANDLRDPYSTAGELLMVVNPYRGHLKLLPKQSELAHRQISSTMDCPAAVRQPEHGTCFVSGDVRTGENSGLAAIQTALARYHNWVARGLKKQNPHWNSDKVFFEARRIVSAILQSITYREYLPPLIGDSYMKKFELELEDKGYWNGYDSKYDASIRNEFTTAAFRYGHSQVAPIANRKNKMFVSSYDALLTADSFFNTLPFYHKSGGGTGAILRGFMTDNAEKTDTNFVDALRNQLFTHRGKAFGMDLLSINILRGRDHGIAGYNKYREFCGLKRAKSFPDLQYEIPQSTITKLKSLYNHVDDIDLYVGGLSENHVKGGIVGPTFACLLAHQFRDLRRGDRFWHEYEYSPHPFTIKQLESIRKTGLASIFCNETLEDMEYVVVEPLRMQNSQVGKIRRCSNVPKLDLSLWATTSQSHYGPPPQDNYYPPTTTTTTTTTTYASVTVPVWVKRLAEHYCNVYQICCEQPSFVYSMIHDQSVRSTAKSFCSDYQVCCDV